MVTLKDIARECGCDISTVSRALQNSPRVRQSTIDKVKAATDKLGYTPNVVAQTLARGKSFVISFLVPSLVSETENLPAMYISKFLIPHAYDLVINQYHESDEMILRQLNRARQGTADAIIIVSSEISLKTFEKHLQNMQLPYIFLDRHCPGVNATTVTSANKTAAEELLKLSKKAGADAYVHFFSRDNTAENERKEGFISKVGDSPYIHCQEDLNKFLKENKVKKLCLFTSVQESAQKFLNDNAELLQDREVYAAVFDHWHGPVFPFEKAFLAEQDWESISEKSVKEILNLIKNKNKKEKFIKVPFLKIAEVKE